MIAKISTGYMVAGYAVAVVLYVGYTVYLFALKRKLERGDDVSAG